MLREYSEFTDCVRKYREHYEIAEAVVRAVDECIRRGILKDFLEKQKAEVIETMLFEYNEEEVLEYLRQEEYEMGLEKGEERGKIIGRVEGAIKLSQKLGQSKEATLSYIREEFQLTRQEAAEYMDGCWDGK